MAETITQSEVTCWELESKRRFLKNLYGMIAWGRSKFQGYDFSAEVVNLNDVYRITLTVIYKVPPYPPKIVLDEIVRKMGPRKIESQGDM